MEPGEASRSGGQDLVESPIGIAGNLCDKAVAGLSATWLGHASVFLQIGAATVLTDPVFSSRIGLRLGRLVIGPERLAPPVAFNSAQLRPNVILLSHAHFDHFDRPTLRRLAHESTSVITARGTRRLVPHGFGAVHELDWDSSIQIEGPNRRVLEIQAMKPRHWGARTIVDRHRRVNAYVVRFNSQSILFAGDTAFTSAFDRMHPPDLALFGIGAYSPWIRHHASPEQVWRMFKDCGGAHLLPIHHSTFALGDEPTHEPIARLIHAAGEESHRIIRVAPGQAWSSSAPSAAPPVTAEAR